MKAFPILCILGLCLAGCATPPAADVTSHRDNVTGLRTDLMADNLLEQGDAPRELLWLNASRVFRSRSQYEYYLEVTYMARAEVGLIEIPPGPSLTLDVDGELITLSGSGSTLESKPTRDGLVKETAIYETSKLTLQKISIAKEVRVAVKGENGLVEREFQEVNLNRFQRFVTRYAL